MSKTVRSRLVHVSLFALSLWPLIGVAVRVSAAPVLPNGGVLAAGQAKIGAPSGASLTVSQSSAKAIIDWNSFSIGQGGAVRFDNGAGATLNRVTGSSLSSIDGLLSASGSVYLLNPNGVLIGKSGVVNVGGSFVASTLDMGDVRFLSGGDLTFTGPSTATVVNLGKVGALGGDVVLTASSVRNQGAITAPQGDVGLLAGSRVVLRDQALDGGRFAVLVGGAGTSVTNSGAIAGAMAELRANGGDVYAIAGDTAGVIRATGVGTRDGRVFLTAGDTGTLILGGTIAARGSSGAGGAIETSAGSVGIGSARIDAGAGGLWLLDPNDLTIDQTAADTIATSLNGGTSVTQQTTASGTGGVGDINVAPNVDLSWTTSAGLTLSAYRNINLGPASTIASAGGGAFTLYADNTGTGVGTVSFGSGAKVSTSGAVNLFYNPTSNSAASAINGASYTTSNDYTAIISGGGALTAYMLVNTLNDLQNIQNNLSGTYALGNDIEARATINWNAGAGFRPIGSAGGAPFSGTLDGQGHSILDVTINDTAAGAGLFGVVAPTGRISNLRLSASVTGAFYAGALVGDNYGVVTNVNVGADITGGGAVGGIVGVGERGSALTGSVTSATVTGAYDDVGGMIGVSLGVLAKDTASGTVNGRNNVGGLAGLSLGSVDHASASGAVTGSNNVGGLVGVNQGGVGGAITDSFATGRVGGIDEVGGLVGVSSGSVASDYASGAVSGTQSVGGLAGGNQGYPNAQVQIGGGSIQNSYATGSVGGTTAIGGLIGTNDGAVTDVYASGQVGYGGVGGLVGLNQTFGTVTNGYWDVSTTTKTMALGGNQGVTFNVVGIGGAVGVNPYAQATYAGFDFSPTGAWVIFDGATRPILRSEASSIVTNAHQLQLIDLDRAGTYTLGADIDLSVVTDPTGVWNPQVGFVPIASRPGPADPFVGSLDGQDHTIANLTIISTYNNVGLFGTIGVAGVVRNLNLETYSVTGANNVGALAGLSLGTIDGVATSAVASSGFGIGIPSDVAGMASVGGLVGMNLGTISNSISRGDVRGSVGCACQFTGGLVGYSSGPIIDSTATGAVSGYQYVGGLGGRVMDVSGSQATGAVTGAFHDVGGLVGQAFGALTNVSASGAVTATADGSENVGGLVGYLNASGVIVGGTATGAVTTVNGVNVGGLVGTSDGAIASAYAGGAVSTVKGVNVGGLVGTSNGSITNAYATGAVGGSFGVGGLVGLVNAGQIASVYASGDVQPIRDTGANGPSGGLIGYTGPSAPSLVDAYWDTTTTHQASVVGAGYSLSQTGGGAISSPSPSGPGSPSPYAQATYAGFDFSASGAWIIFDGFTRPMLKSEASSSITNAHQLQLIQLNLAGAYKLPAPVDLGAVQNQSDVWNPATGFVPIGSPAGGGAPFNGSLVQVFFAVGGEASISGLYIDRPNSDGVGLFGVIGNGGRVVGVTLGDVSVTGRYYTGGLAGDNRGSVTGASISGAVSGVGGVGGIVGVSEFGSTIGGSTAGLVTYTPPGPELSAGYEPYPVYHPIEVTGTDGDVGGIAGVNIGTITGAAGQGGVAGGRVTGSYNVGGVAGLNVGLVTFSSSSAIVAGAASVGGLVGRNDGAVSLSFAYGTTTANGTSPDYAGGLVGLNSASGSVSDSYASGASNVAGLIGRNDGVVSRAFTIGPVGPQGAGVTAFNDGVLTDVYWDVGATGTSTGVAGGPGSNVDVLPIGGSTGRDPNLASSYPGFDFTNVWTLSGPGYPGLPAHR